MDNNKEIKDIDKMEYSPETSLFNNRPDLLYIFKKTQKISYVLYMISDLFDKEEPLRLSLRKGATELVPLALSLIKNEGQGSTKNFNLFTSSLLEVLSYCEAGYFSHLISEANFGILQSEINKLAEMVEAKKEKPMLLSPHQLETPTQDFYNERANAYKRHLSFTTNVPKNVPNFQTNSIKDKIGQRDAYARNSNISHPSSIKTEHKNQRSEIIVGLLKNGKELTIKDFHQHITDCSEKTIQRELLSLVAKGVLKKKGERRWSRYSISSPSI